LMRQYRKMRRVMSDSILVGVLDVPEVYEPGKFSNEFEKTETTKQMPLRVEETKPVASQPKKAKSQFNPGKAAKIEESRQQS